MLLGEITSLKQPLTSPVPEPPQQHPQMDCETSQDIPVSLRWPMVPVPKPCTAVQSQTHRSSASSSVPTLMATVPGPSFASRMQTPHETICAINQRNGGTCSVKHQTLPENQAGMKHVAGYDLTCLMACTNENFSPGIRKLRTFLDIENQPIQNISMQFKNISYLKTIRYSGRCINIWIQKVQARDWRCQLPSGQRVVKNLNYIITTNPNENTMVHFTYPWKKNGC